jgi:hypothetical protein
VCVLIKDGLEAAVDAVLDHTEPIRLAAIESAHERDDFRQVEQVAEPPRDAAGGEPHGLVAE